MPICFTSMSGPSRLLQGASRSRSRSRSGAGWCRLSSYLESRQDQPLFQASDEKQSRNWTGVAAWIWSLQTNQLLFYLYVHEKREREREVCLCRRQRGSWVLLPALRGLIWSRSGLLKFALVPNEGLRSVPSISTVGVDFFNPLRSLLLLKTPSPV